LRKISHRLLSSVRPLAAAGSKQLSKAALDLAQALKKTKRHCTIWTSGRESASCYRASWSCHWRSSASASSQSVGLQFKSTMAHQKRRRPDWRWGPLAVGGFGSEGGSFRRMGAHATLRTCVLGAGCGGGGWRSRQR